MVLPRYQLEYDMHDLPVLQDAIKLTLCFLERNDQRPGGGANVPQYNAVERRRIEAFLRHYVKHQFGLTSKFDAVFGPPIDQAEWEDLGLYVAEDGAADDSDDEGEIHMSRKLGMKPGGSSSAVSIVDLKNKLYKTKKAVQKSNAHKRNETSKETSGSNTSIHQSTSSSQQASPAPENNDPISPEKVLQSEIRTSTKEKNRAADVDDIWLQHVDLNLPHPNPVDGDVMNINAADGKTAKVNATTFGSFFCNTNFYTLIRLLQVRCGFFIPLLILGLDIMLCL
jgi:paired amphipathic helix protein Sin3a